MDDIHPHSQEYVKVHRQADEVLLEWSRIKARIINMLIDTPVSFVRKLWDDPRLISVSRHCDYDNSVIRCNPCMLRYHLVKLDDNDQGIIENGSLADTHVMAERAKNMINFTSIVEHYEQYVKDVVKELEQVTCDEFNANETLYIASDRFTNDALITWLLEDIMRRSHLQHYLKLYNFYVCDGTGIKVRDDCAYRNIKAVHDDIGLDTGTVRGVLGQLLVLYSVLEPYQFTHGSATVKSLKFEAEHHSLTYQGKKVECPVTVKLCHLQDAGLTIARNGQEEDLLNGKVVGARDRLRIYPRNPLIDDCVGDYSKIVHTGMPEIPAIAVHLHGEQGEVRRYSYQNGANFLRFYRHSGLALYRGFDLVCFFCSLMSYSPFYRVVMADEDLKHMWTSLWREKDLDFLTKEMEHLHEHRLALVKTLDVAKLLVDIEIRCDVLEHLWGMY